MLIEKGEGKYRSLGRDERGLKLMQVIHSIKKKSRLCFTVMPAIRPRRETIARKQNFRFDISRIAQAKTRTATQVKWKRRHTQYP